MAEYTQGICEDGAAILKDGVMLTPDEIVAELTTLRASAAEKEAKIERQAERIAELEGRIDEVCESTADFLHSLGRYENGDPRMPWSGIRQDLGILHENYDNLKSLISTPTGERDRTSEIEKAVWEEAITAIEEAPAPSNAQTYVKWKNFLLMHIRKRAEGREE